MNFKKLAISAVIAATVMTTGCSKVPNGYDGIKVNLLGSSKGVAMEELTPGRYWIGLNEELYLFPNFKQTVVWTADGREGSETDESITFQSIEGLDIGANIGISYTIVPGYSSQLFKEYRKGINEISDVYLRNKVRDAFIRIASKMKADELYGVGKSVLIDKVTKRVHDKMIGRGIDVEDVYLIGKLNLPSAIIKAINDTVRSTQKAVQRENEVAEATAAAKKVIEASVGKATSITNVATAEAAALESLATAKAKEIRDIGAALTEYPDVVRYLKSQRWNGQLPKVVGGVTPMVDINAL